MKLRNKMNAKELIELIERNFERDFWGFLDDFEEYYKGDMFDEKHPTYDDFKANDNVDYAALRKERERVRDAILKKLGIGEVDQLDQYGGEGQGDSFWSVIHFKDHDIYLKWSGWYASYDGWYLESPPEEVKPKTKEIVVYE